MIITGANSKLLSGELATYLTGRHGSRHAPCLGELNDSQLEEWQHAVEALDEKGNVRQLKLFPEDRAPETVDGHVVRIRMDWLAIMKAIVMYRLTDPD